MSLFPQADIKIDTHMSVAETIAAFRAAQARRWYSRPNNSMYQEEIEDPIGVYNERFYTWTKDDAVLFRINQNEKNAPKPKVYGRIIHNPGGSTILATVRYAISMQIMFGLLFAAVFYLFVAALVNMIAKAHFNIALVFAILMFSFLYYAVYHTFKSRSVYLINLVRSVFDK